ncbi:MAG: FAD-binding protein [Candidatus Poribacteria bacterium]|nr:FAD-binding protein [Candidatus Poribacteria bacterium]
MAHHTPTQRVQIDVDAVTHDLAKIVGADRVLSDDTSMMVYETDGATLYKSKPHVVVFPDTTAHVSQIVKYANAKKIPFLARGAGTGLSGGALAGFGGIIIAMNRMNRILKLDIENRRAVVEPGVVNLWITNAATQHGYHYAPDPSSQKACTIGGNIAENSGGPHTLKYGVTVNHIAEMEVVLPNGEITTVGSGGDDPIGYDVMAMLIGSEGTLGIATTITVKLTRNPQGYKTLLAVFHDIDDATNSVSEIIASGMIPAALEMMDRLIIKAVEEAFGFGFPSDAEAVLIVELDGLTVGMEEQAEQIVRICKERNAANIQVANSAAERDLLWKSRKQAFGALGRIAKSYLTQDGVVPRTKLPEVLRTVYEISKKYDMRIANVFHAGDGNIHPILLFDEDDPAQEKAVLDASGEILKKCVDVGGTITGEHGVGVEKMAFMTLLFTPEDLDLMLTVRSLFNPDNLLNPGKIFPSDDMGMGIQLDG